jgi:hypothetical protein
MLMSHRAGVRHRVTRADQETEPRTAASMVPLIAAHRFLASGYPQITRITRITTAKTNSTKSKPMGLFSA